MLVMAMTSTLSASTNLGVDDYTYELLLRLEAEGVIRSGLLTTKPLSRKEAARLIIEAEEMDTASPFIRRIIDSLKREFEPEIKSMKYIKLPDRVYVKYIYADRNASHLSYNNDGDAYSKGSNVRVGISGRGEYGWVSFLISPELGYSDNDGDLGLKRAYGIFSFWGLGLTLGRESQWWGPGYHGSLLMSNNAAPMTTAMFTNPEPKTLPWVFKYFGPVRFAFFVTGLEKERVIREPKLWGLRLNLKPMPYVELGIQRTALLGGKGRSEDIGTWWRSFTGEGENVSGVEAGDQRAGGDIKITLPFRVQPVQLYMEAAGEDEAGGLPGKWAYITGIYLPRVFNLERFGFRAEYAKTTDVWYKHHIYSGYTYKGRIIGHHMGGDSMDLFTELSYLIPEKKGKISLSYDREEHNLSIPIRPIRERKDEAALKMNAGLREKMELEVICRYGKVRNTGNIAGEDKNIGAVSAMVNFTL